MSIARRSQLLFLVLLLTNVVSLLAQDVTAVFTTPSGTLTAGSRASLWLFCMNNSSNSVIRTFEPSLRCTLTAQSVTFETVLLLNTKSSPRAATIAPGGFVVRAQAGGRVEVVPVESIDGSLTAAQRAGELAGDSGVDPAIIAR